MDTPFPLPPPRSISFGWDRRSDEASLAAVLAQFARPEFLATLTPRLSDEEIADLVGTLTGLMKRHLSESEYHRLFLQAASP